MSIEDVLRDGLEYLEIHNKYVNDGDIEITILNMYIAIEMLTNGYNIDDELMEH